MKNELLESVTNVTQEDILIQVLENQKQLKQQQKSLESDVDYLKNEQPVNPSVCLDLERIRKKKVIDILGGKDSPAYRDSRFARSVFAQAARDFKDHFRIPRYDLLKRKDELNAYEYWRNWEPNTNTKFDIKARNKQLEILGGLL